jgi:hypothetical protein
VGLEKRSTASIDADVTEQERPVDSGDAHSSNAPTICS